RSVDSFTRSPLAVSKDMAAGGGSAPWSLLVIIAVGVWLMCTRLTLGHGAALADWEHLIGALIITVGVCAMAEVARPARYLLIPLALVLLPLPFVVGANVWGIASNLVAAALVAGMALIPLPVKSHYGSWDQLLRREKVLWCEKDKSIAEAPG